MKLSIRERYALQALGALAAAKSATRMRAQEIADEEGIPRKFLEQVLLALRKGGLIESVRGRDGGYVLRRRPESVSVREALEAMKGPVALLPCLAPDGPSRCPECTSDVCWLRHALAPVSDAIGEALAGLTLADLARAFQEAHAPERQAYMYYI